MAVEESKIPINMFLDAVKFQAVLHDINMAVSSAADIASVRSARLIADAIKAKLEMFPHPHDPSAISPAPPFKGPVGMLTTGRGRIIPGHLRDSVTVEAMPSVHGAKVYPSAIYARIQEFGGWTGGSRVLYRHISYHPIGFQMLEGPFKSGSHHVYLPPRPYFRPTIMEAESFGAASIERIYYDEWRDAMRTAIAF